MIRLVSIEVTNRCAKACWFCYNHSGPGRDAAWEAGEVVEFAEDCWKNGVEAFSFGGGEPLEYAPLFDLLAALPAEMFTAVTTNGLLLSDEAMAALAAARVNKVHVSIHFPDRTDEVERAARQVLNLRRHGMRAGINLVVRRDQIDDATRAAAHLHAVGITNQDIVYLPMRVQLTPAPRDIARAAGSQNFQSTSCLTRCGKSERFVSIDAQKRAAWCSYTTARRPLPTLTYNGMLEALDNLDVVFCGGKEE